MAASGAEATIGEKHLDNEVRHPFASVGLIFFLCRNFHLHRDLCCERATLSVERVKYHYHLRPLRITVSCSPANSLSGRIIHVIANSDGTCHSGIIAFDAPAPTQPSELRRRHSSHHCKLNQQGACLQIEGSAPRSFSQFESRWCWKQVLRRNIR